MLQWENICHKKGNLFNFLGSQYGRKESALLNCPLATSCMLYHVCTHIHTPFISQNVSHAGHSSDNVIGMNYLSLTCYIMMVDIVNLTGSRNHLENKLPSISRRISLDWTTELRKTNLSCAQYHSMDWVQNSSLSASWLHIECEQPPHSPAVITTLL